MIVCSDCDFEAREGLQIEPIPQDLPLERTEGVIARGVIVKLGCSPPRVSADKFRSLCLFRDPARFAAAGVCKMNARSENMQWEGCLQTWSPRPR